jgi:ABC-type glycerol-3-phosphate transport system substrate-binding protein
MKKFRTLLLTMLLGAALAACGGGNDPNVDSPAAGDETPVAPASGDVDTPGTDGVNEGDNDVIGDAEDDGIDGVENTDPIGADTTPTVAP